MKENDKPHLELDTPRGERPVDQAVEGTFPASDPIALAPIKRVDPEQLARQRRRPGLLARWFGSKASGGRR